MSDSVEEFSDKMSTILNYGALNLAMGIGYRLKLFDIMDAFEQPRTSEDIAHKAGLSPRSVKDWLAVMVTLAAPIPYRPHIDWLGLQVAHVLIWIGGLAVLLRAELKSPRTTTTRSG